MLTICFFIDGVLSFNSVYSTNSSDGFSFLSLFIYFHKLADEIGSLYSSLSSLHILFLLLIFVRDFDCFSLLFSGSTKRLCLLCVTDFFWKHKIRHTD